MITFGDPHFLRTFSDKSLTPPRARATTAVMFRLPPLLLSALFLFILGCDEPPAAPAKPAASATPTAQAPASVAQAAPTPSATASAQDKPTEAAAKPEWITAQHVLVAFKGAKNAQPNVKRSKEEAKKRAEEVAAKAKAGEDFTALVKEYSDDTATLDRLGSVGKFKPESMAKPFSDAAFALKVEGVSDPVETQFGFHVIKRNQ